MIIIELRPKAKQSLADFENEYSRAIKFAVRSLEAGWVVAYPAETVYGLGCDATNQDAVKRIYKIKGKQKEKSLGFLVSSLAMAGKYLLMDKRAKEFAKKYWPGALTLVLPTTASGRESLKLKTGGTRISSHPIANNLVKALGVPLVSTSANPTGLPTATSGKEIIEYFKNQKHQPDLILDVGKLKKSKGSTYLDLTKDVPVVLREGDVKIDNS